MKNVQAALEEQVCKRGIEDWIKAWYRWFYGIAENRHPSLSHFSIDRRQDQAQGKLSFLYSKDSKPPKKCDSKVWFLTGGYQEAISTRSFIPPGNFYILAPLYAASASTAEYPSLKSTKVLNDFCDRDVTGVKLGATLDGRKIASYQVRINKLFPVDLPVQNILGLPVPRGKPKRTIDIVSNGHWVWLKPLSIGDHRLHLYGSSSSFVSELNLSLSVAGPP
jgi:hypothetical protein